MICIQWRFLYLLFATLDELGETCGHDTTCSVGGCLEVLLFVKVVMAEVN